MFRAAARLILAGLVAIVPIAAAAQVVPPTAQPGREREQLTEPPPTLARPTGPVITLPGSAPPEGASSIKLRLYRVRVVGSTVYGNEELAGMFRGLVGHEITLAQVYEFAKEITARYGRDGYVLTRAIVPPQNFERRGADVLIRVVEGYIDAVVWPDAVKRYRDFFSDYTAKILAARPANIRVIERYLLLAGDLPGLRFTSRLRPSREHQGAAVLVIEVKEKRLEVAARIDNRGSEARGPYQYLFSATANNYLRGHESFNFTYAGTFEMKELQYVAGSFRKVLTSEGQTIFVNLSYGAGRPGLDALELLEYKTRSLIFETGFSYPAIRARDRNLFLTALMFSSDSNSDALGSAFSEDRLRGFRLRADADYADSLAGINRFSATLSQGLPGLGSTANDNPMASVVGGHADFTKLEVTASRIQPLAAGFSLALSVEAQYAFDTLLAPEQCSYGGRTMGRAYDPSALTGDHCFNTGAELRYDLPLAPFKARSKTTAPWLDGLAQAQLYGYLDHGDLYYRSPAAGTPEHVDAASAGFGVRLGWLEYVSLDLSLAKAIDGPRDDWRGFFILTARN